MARLVTKWAETTEELCAAQRLRYDVFVAEMGGDGPMVDHCAQIEADQFDPYCEHLLLMDQDRPSNAQVVGAYRVLPGEIALQGPGFYSATEFDLSPLIRSGRKLLELGRSCVAAEFRGGTGVFHLWQALAEYVLCQDVSIMFGVASFPGTEIPKLAPALNHLTDHYLAPADIRVRATPAARVPETPSAIDALGKMPALIKAYLRLGGVVGDGVFIDHAFNTTDICLILDTENMNSRQRQFFEKRHQK